VDFVVPKSLAEAVQAECTSDGLVLELGDFEKRKKTRSDLLC
jgi:hypothetical protein